MELRHRAVALYGRFSAGVRDRLLREIIAHEGVVARDLTRSSDILVIGALATTLIESGALSARLRTAAARGVPVLGERGFIAALAQAQPTPATLPLSAALSGTALTRDDVDLLAAFDLVVLAGENCRFGDAAALRTADDLIRQGRSRADVVRILARARDLSPSGRHKIVLTPSGEAALQWDDGLTTLEGQRYLPLDMDHASSIDEMFEAAELAEADGDHEGAARLYDICARGDRGDPIAPYNLANIRLAQGAHDAAALAYQRALARDPSFVEARYNLALAFEALGKDKAAREELARVLALDPGHSDAVFNLAQLHMKAGDIAEAKALYERYLALSPPEDWAATARKAITYCAARLAI